MTERRSRDAISQLCAIKFSILQKSPHKAQRDYRGSAIERITNLAVIISASVFGGMSSPMQVFLTSEPVR
ncbi:hypothetical protein DYH55_22370 [Methylovirgula sp. 4M-Z18]|nr:hypothetical protein DYH55_22370 [Methylovirgula sp. 4M-Z18]